MKLDLSQYETDKVDAHYLDKYGPLLAQWVNKPVHLLELGVFRGASLLLWRDYFPEGQIVGVDIKLPQGFEPPDRIRVFEGSQGDTAFLTRVAAETAAEGFDIIIDDASHTGELTRTSFWHLFDRHLKPGGLYVIEDWGTGYWNDWPDGKGAAAAKAETETLGAKLARRLDRTLRDVRRIQSHDYGMVGFVKELVDELGAGDVTRGEGRPPRQSRFESVLMFPSIVFVRKQD